MRHNGTPPKGYALLAGLLVISAVLLSLGLALNSRMRDFSLDATLIRDRVTASALAASCADEAQLRLIRDRNFRTGQLNISSALCTMTVNVAGTLYTIIAEGKSGTAIRTIEVQLDDSASLLKPKRYHEIP